MGLTLLFVLAQEEDGVLCRVEHIDFHRRVPVVRDLGERRIKSREKEGINPFRDKLMERGDGQSATRAP
jgi:phosphoenolpyruvate synthase/pyruvate phosphate dikinase